MQLLFTLLVFVAIGLVALFWVVAFAARAGKLRQLALDLNGFAVILAWMVAATCMVGSLYFSEAANYEPCKLCWYQRVCMYSIAIVLLVALIRRTRDIAPYVITLACIGTVISIYHYLVEWYPTLESDVCSLTVPCTTVWFRRAGFVSLPFMALTGFVTILSLLVAPRVAGIPQTPDNE